MAAVRTTPPGWKLAYEGGKRRAINPQGENVSYNAYLNAQAKRSGFKSFAEYRKVAPKLKGYRAHPEAAKKLQLGSAELKTFKRRILDRKRQGDLSAHGPLARYLEDLGVRPKGAEYPVGDTPGKE